MRAIQRINSLITTVMSMSGFIPKHMTLSRVTLLLASFVFLPLVLKKGSFSTSILYFLVNTVIYYGFIFFALSDYGKSWRKSLIEKYGEERAFIRFETILTIIFFHNATSLSYISQTTGSGLSFFNIPVIVFQVVGLSIYVFSNVVAIWSAQVLSIPLYYWKDMFLNKKINTFVASGPYKIFNNPMYGIGRLQYYGLALCFGSLYGLLAALISQTLLFLFYYIIEMPFVRRMYLQ